MDAEPGSPRLPGSPGDGLTRSACQKQKNHIFVKHGVLVHHQDEVLNEGWKIRQRSLMYDIAWELDIAQQRVIDGIGRGANFEDVCSNELNRKITVQGC